MKNAIYLDHAAATPIDSAVKKAMEPYSADQFYNPSAVYIAARDVRLAYEAARKQVAGVLGAKPGEIIFTAGGTEANNLAIRGVIDANSGSKAVVSAIEHDSVLQPAKSVDAKIVKVDNVGVVDLVALTKAITDDVALVSVMYANNEIGTIQPLKEISEAIKAVRADRQDRDVKTPLYFHTDACQAANYLDLRVDALGVDLMTLNGGKIYGPKQSGCLYVRAGIKLSPLVLGGGQEYGLRSGTENIAQSVGFAAALVASQQMRSAESKRVRALRVSIQKSLTKAIPEIQVNGHKKAHLPNNLSVTLPGIDGERAVMLLDELGVQCATGAACSANKEDVSHVLAAIGLDGEEASGTLRFTLGRLSSEADVSSAAKVIANALSDPSLRS